MVRSKSITTAIVASVSLTAASFAGCATVGLQEGTPVQLSASPPAQPPPPPPPPPPVVEVEETRIRVDEKIHFEFDSAEISAVSDDLIQAIAQVLIDNPQVVRLRVEGHTDAQGTAEYNLDLSKRRATSVVEALIARGVDEARLEPAGYGVTRPVDDNGTEEGRAANRRVEFNILERDDSLKPPAAAPTPEGDDDTTAPTSGGEAPAETDDGSANGAEGGAK